MKLFLLFWHSAGLRNGIKMILGEGSARLIITLGTLYAARKIGVEAYGDYGVFWAKCQLAWTVIEFGTSMSGIRESASTADTWERGGIISNTISLRLIFFFVVAGGGLAYGAIPPLQGLLAAICLLGLLATPDWVYRSLEMFKSLGAMQFLGAISFVATAIYFSNILPGVVLLLTCNAVQIVTVAIVLWIGLPADLRAASWQRPTAEKMVRYAKRGSIFALTGILLQGGIAGFLAGVSAQFGAIAAGMATAVLRIYQLANTAVFMFAVGFFPRLSRKRTSHEPEILRKFMLTVGIFSAITFPTVIMPLAERCLGSAYLGVSKLGWWISSGLLWAAIRYSFSISLVARYRQVDTVIANFSYFVLASSGPYLAALVTSRSEAAVLSIALAELLALIFLQAIRFLYKYEPVK